MSVTVITPAALESVIAMDLLFKHLKLEDADEEQIVQAYAEAAVGVIDGPGGWLGRALGVQTLEARLDGFGCELLALTCPPLIEIVSVKYDDVDGVEQTLAADVYEIDPAGVALARGKSWPATAYGRGVVRVRYEAGYEVGIPAAIRSAILLMVGDLYANRETGVVGTVSADVKMSTTVDNLLSPYRVWSA